MGGVWPRRRGVFAVAVGLLALATVAASGACAAPATSFCTRGSRQPSDNSRCMRVPVPLDRSGATPGTIRLLVAIKPPTSGTAQETILALAGGPGQAAVPFVDDLALALPQTALRSRQLVTFDQRGTGSSGRLTCPGLSRVLADPTRSALVDRAVSACATHLGAARTHYSTADSVADIEAVRAALGVERMTLWGTSYGTKVALDYAAAYPQHVERLLLDSALAPEGVDPFRRLTIGSIPRVMREICSRDGCPFTHDAGDDVDALGARLAAGPLHGTFVGGDGRPRPADLTGSGVLRLLLTEDVDPQIRVQLPGAVRSALDGDPALLLRLVAVPGVGLGSDVGGSDALYVATTCEDGGVPWGPGTPIADRAAAVGAALAAVPAVQLAPFGAQAVRGLGFADLCRAWPESPIAQPQPPLPDVPALILSGDEDLRTPRREAFALAARMPHAQVLDVPQTGHSTLGSAVCARTAVGAFLSDRPVRPCARSKPAVTPFAPLPRSFAAVRPLRGFSLRVGRTLGAVGDTMMALVLQAVEELIPRLALDPNERVLRVGGLHGGSLAIDSRTTALHGYCVVPGVTLSAADFGSDDPVLSIDGRSAAHGWLRISADWVEGRLGGERVRVRFGRLFEGLGGLLAGSVSAAGQSPVRLPVLPRPLARLLAAEEASSHAS